MTFNQLFKKKPTLELVFQILNLLKFNSVDDFKTRTFSKNDMTPKVLEEMEKLKPVFEEYYIKCKFDIYFTFLDEKKIITILRQCLKLLDYRLDSKKEYISGKRYIVYTIVSTTEPPVKPCDPLKSNKSCTIVFD